MNRWKAGVAVSALMAGAFANAAAADLTAEEAWASLRDVMTASGYNATGTESRSGDTLQVSGAVFEMVMPEPGGSARVDLGTLSFVENGDGTVSVTMPEVIPFTMNMVVEDDQPVSMGYRVVQTGVDMVMSGTPDDIVQSYKADKVAMTIDQFDVPDEEFSSDMVKIDLTMTDLTSTTRIGSGEPRPMEFSGTAGGIAYDLSVAVPGEGGMVMKGDLKDLNIDGAGALPTAVPSADFLAMLQAGYAMKGTATHGGGTMAVAGEEEGSNFAFESRSGAGGLTFDATADSLTYGLSQTDTAITVTTSDLPFPVEMEMQGATAGLTMPLIEGPDPQDFALQVHLSDFSMSDVIWSMFDGAAILPRDPATLLLDLTGKATILANFLDPTIAEQLEESGSMPAQLNVLDINGLQLKLAGAELTGAGGFTFDNADIQTFGGMPKPTGSVDLALTGANTLLDRLQQLGFIGPEEAGGARMMMGLLAVPGEGPDSLKSTLEINDQGHIMANGQRIQ